MDIKSINKRITQLCKKNNWSYYRLAKEAGFQQSTLKSITKEQNMPSLYTLSKICEAFKITISDFFDDEIFSPDIKYKHSFIKLWNELQPPDKERVLIYIHGLLHKTMKEEEQK